MFLKVFKSFFDIWILWILSGGGGGGKVVLEGDKNKWFKIKRHRAIPQAYINLHDLSSM